MTPVGETLRRERMKRNLDIEEISRELKISPRFLHAIEDDHYEKLPGGVFAKSFVRQYARLLGLDEEQIAGQVQQSLAPPPDFTQLPDKPKASEFAPIQVPKVDEWETVGDRGFRWSGWGSVAALVAVILVCSAVYTWMQRPKTVITAQVPTQSAAVQTAPVQSTSVSTQPAPPTVNAVQPVAGPNTNPAQPITSVAKTVAQTPQAGFTSPADLNLPDASRLDAKPIEPKPVPMVDRTVPAGGSPVRVTITADEPVWVLVRTDGKYAFSATMDPNTTRTVEGARDVMVRLGNAGGVTISLNGKPIGPAGPKGQVRTIQFTSGGFQIVPAKPPSAPPASARL